MIDYNRLRKLSPEAARQAVLDYLQSVAGNVSATARAFGIGRKVVYDIKRRAATGHLADRSRAPHTRPSRTAPAIEARVVAARNRTHLGYRQLSIYLADRGLPLSWQTIRNILHRNRHRLTKPPRKRRRAPQPPSPTSPVLDYLRRRGL
jgi:transposase-like protein